MKNPWKNSVPKLDQRVNLYVRSDKKQLNIEIQNDDK